jgi:hypothetical protein
MNHLNAGILKRRDKLPRGPPSSLYHLDPGTQDNILGGMGWGLVGLLVRSGLSFMLYSSTLPCSLHNPPQQTWAG